MTELNVAIQHHSELNYCTQFCCILAVVCIVSIAIYARTILQQYPAGL